MCLRRCVHNTQVKFIRVVTNLCHRSRLGISIPIFAALIKFHHYSEICEAGSAYQSQRKYPAANELLNRMIHRHKIAHILKAKLLMQINLVLSHFAAKISSNTARSTVYQGYNGQSLIKSEFTR